MRRNTLVETPRDRVALAADAGLGKLSAVSVAAGTLVAYGAFLVVLAIAGGVAAAVGVKTDLGNRDLRQLGIGGGIAVALVLLVAYLFGGYVAGRMARRAGAANGVLVFVLGLVVAGLIAAAVDGLGGTDRVVDGVRSVGLPTTASQWRDIGTVAGIGSLLAMLVGAVLGGALGERWHTKLLTRALDPTVGPEATLRADAETSRQRADERHDAAQERVMKTSATGVVADNRLRGGVAPTGVAPTGVAPTRVGGGRLGRVDREDDDRGVAAGPAAAWRRRSPFGRSHGRNDDDARRAGAERELAERQAVEREIGERERAQLRAERERAEREAERTGERETAEREAEREMAEREAEREEAAGRDVAVADRPLARSGRARPLRAVRETPVGADDRVARRR
jgi:hypothetical protein